MLGCPDCYETFERQLTPMIERAQNGGTSHAGKCPRRVGVSLDRQLQIQRLIKEMEDAVAAEQYERAAELRDLARQGFDGRYRIEPATEGGGRFPPGALNAHPIVGGRPLRKAIVLAPHEGRWTILRLFS